MIDLFVDRYEPRHLEGPWEGWKVPGTFIESTRFRLAQLPAVGEEFAEHTEEGEVVWKGHVMAVRYSYVPTAAYTPPRVLVLEER